MGCEWSLRCYAASIGRVAGPNRPIRASFGTCAKGISSYYDAPRFAPADELSGCVGVRFDF